MDLFIDTVAASAEATLFPRAQDALSGNTPEYLRPEAVRSDYLNTAAGR
jgi:hypothetical protein